MSRAASRFGAPEILRRLGLKSVLPANGLIRTPLLRLLLGSIGEVFHCLLEAVNTALTVSSLSSASGPTLTPEIATLVAFSLTVSVARSTTRTLSILVYQEAFSFQRAGSGASKIGSIRTVPVNQSAGPFTDGREPALLISMNFAFAPGLRRWFRRRPSGLHR